MDVDIFVLVKVRIDPERLGAAAQAGDGGTCRLLHHVAQVAGQLDAAGALHHGALDVEHFPADRGIRKAAHKADLVARTQLIVDVFPRSEQFFQPIGANGNTLHFTLGDREGRLAADARDFAFQHTDARFARIAADDGADRGVVKAQLRGLQPVFLPLLGDQVALGDLQLFLVGIARHLDDLHAVKERARDRVGGICGRDEEHTGEIERDLEEVVPEAAVLLAVKRLKKGGRRVAPIVRAELIDLVEHHQRVARLGLDDAGDDAARHRADIGFAVAADLGLVMYAAERDAHALAACRPGDRHGNARLARAGRADKTDQSALYLRRQLAHSQVFKDPLLDLFKPVMIVFKHFARLVDIDGLFALDAPRDLQAGVEITADDSRLGRTEGLLLQLGHFLEQSLADLVADRQRADLGAICIELVAFTLSAKLRLDQLELFAQIVFALRAVDLLLRGLVEFLFDVQDLDLAREHLTQHRESAAGVQLFEQLLLVFNGKAHVLRDITDYKAEVGI